MCLNIVLNCLIQLVLFGIFLSIDGNLGFGNLRSLSVFTVMPGFPGYRTGTWIHARMEDHKHGKISQERVDELEKID